MAVTHRVRRLTWLVRAGSHDDALMMRLRARGELLATTLGELESAFDRMENDGALIRIPKLSLNVKLPAPDAPAELLGEIVREQLNRLWTQPDGPFKDVSAGGDGDASTQTTMLTQAELIVGYVRTGTLAWHLAALGTHEVLEWLGATAQRELSAVADAIQSSSDPEARTGMWIRLLQVLPRSSWGEAAVMVSSTTFPEVAATVAQAIASLASATEIATAPAIAAVILSTAGSGSPPAPGLPEALRRLMRGDPGGVEQWMPAPASERSTSMTLSGEAAGLRSQSRDPEVEEIDRARTRAGSEARRSTSAESLGSPAASSTVTGALGAEPLPGESAQPLGLIVSNAGLILLSPYLERFFEATAVVEPGQRTIPEVQLARGAALLNHLALGRGGFDFEQGIVKVLLGLSPAARMPLLPAPITSHDGAEVSALLEAVMRHWAAMRGTSVDGFRASFLQRPGILVEERQGWRLRVETLAFDILLESLPWGFATVRLPWMGKPIFTEWLSP